MNVLRAGIALIIIEIGNELLNILKKGDGKKRSVLTRKWISEKICLDASGNLLKEYKNYFRISEGKFENSLSMIEHKKFSMV